LLRDVVSWGIARFVAPYAAYLTTREERRGEEGRGVKEKKMRQLEQSRMSGHDEVGSSSCKRRRHRLDVT
jgi:hypothetical protein